MTVPVVLSPSKLKVPLLRSSLAAPTEVRVQASRLNTCPDPLMVRRFPSATSGVALEPRELVA